MILWYDTFKSLIFDIFEVNIWQVYFTSLCKMQVTAKHDSYRLWLFCSCHSLLILSLNLSLFHKWFWRVLHVVVREGCLSRLASRVEPFGCTIAVFWFRCQRHGFDPFQDFLLLSACHFVGSDTSIMCSVPLGSFQHCKLCFKLSKYWLWREKVWNIPWTCFLLSLYIMMPGVAIW